MKILILLITLVTTAVQIAGQLPILNGKLEYVEFNDLQNYQSIKSVKQFVTYVKDSSDLYTLYPKDSHPYYYLQNTFCEFDNSQNIIVYNKYNFKGQLVQTDTNRYADMKLIQQIKAEGTIYTNQNGPDTIHYRKIHIDYAYGNNGKISIATSKKLDYDEKEIISYYYKDTLFTGFTKRYIKLKWFGFKRINDEFEEVVESKKTTEWQRTRHHFSKPNQWTTVSRFLFNNHIGYIKSRFQLIENKWELTERRNNSFGFTSNTYFQYLGNENLRTWITKGAWDSTLTKYDSFNRIIFQKTSAYRDYKIFKPQFYSQRLRELKNKNNLNEKKDLIKEARYGESNNIYKYEYILDQNNNWIQLKCFKNDKLTWTIERKYEYH